MMSRQSDCAVGPSQDRPRIMGGPLSYLRRCADSDAMTVETTCRACHGLGGARRVRMRLRTDNGTGVVCVFMVLSEARQSDRQGFDVVRRRGVVKDPVDVALVGVCVSKKNLWDGGEQYVRTEILGVCTYAPNPGWLRCRAAMLQQ